MRKIILEETKKQIIEAYLSDIPLTNIATKFSICTQTIDNIVNAAGIVRDRCQKHRKYDYDLVCALYKEGKSVREVAIETGGSRSSIAAIVKGYGVSRINKIREHIYKKNAKKCPKLSKSFISYLDGLVISDGYISRPSKNSPTAFYQQSSISKDWLEEIQNKFKEQSIESTVYEEFRHGIKTGYILKTLNYDQLFIQRKRWYDLTGKIVPRDIDFSVGFLLNWVYGDGTKVKTTLRLCCDSFSESEVDFLMNKLRSLGFGFKKILMGYNKDRKPKWRLSLCKRDGVIEFYQLLGKPSVESLSYKWLY